MEEFFQGDINMEEFKKAVQKVTNWIVERVGDYARWIDKRVLPVKVRTYDELIYIPSDDEEVKAAQDLHDAYIICRAYCRRHGNSTADRLEYELNQVVLWLTGSPIPDWIPSRLSARVIQLIRLKPSVANIFETIKLPSDDFQPPAALSGITVSKVAAGRQVTPSTSSASSVRFCAKRLAACAQIVVKLCEDDIVPIIPTLQNELAYAFADALDKLILKGDTASSDNTLNAWDGLLKLAGETDNTEWSAQKVLEAALTLDTFSPYETVLIVNPTDFTEMVGWSEVTPVGKYGDKATIITGELAKVWGIPVVVSPHADAPVVVLRRAFRLGIRPRMDVGILWDAQTQSDFLVVSLYADFKQVAGTNVVKRVCHRPK